MGFNGVGGKVTKSPLACCRRQTDSESRYPKGVPMRRGDPTVRRRDCAPGLGGCQRGLSGRRVLHYPEPAAVGQHEVSRSRRLLRRRRSPPVAACGGDGGGGAPASGKIAFVSDRDGNPAFDFAPARSSVPQGRSVGVDPALKGACIDANCEL